MKASRRLICRIGTYSSRLRWRLNPQIRCVDYEGIKAENDLVVTLAVLSHVELQSSTLRFSSSRGAFDHLGIDDPMVGKLLIIFRLQPGLQPCQRLTDISQVIALFERY